MKKSLLSTPVLVVKTPCLLPLVGAEHPVLADDGRHLRTGQIQHVGLVEQQPLQWQLLALPGVIAEAVRPRFQSRERVDIGWAWLASVRRPGWNGTFTLTPASAAAFSTAAEPASTIRSASEILRPPAADLLKELPGSSPAPATPCPVSWAR